MSRRTVRAFLLGLATTLLTLQPPATAAFAADAPEGAPEAAVGPRWAAVDPGAYLGVRLTEETEHEEGGARVSQVIEGSPAARAGIREGDIVIGFGGHLIRGPVALTRRIHERSAGEVVKVRLLREGREREIDVELGERESPVALLVPGDGQRQHWLEWSQALEERAEGLNKQLGELQFSAPEIYGRALALASPVGGRPTLGVQLVETTAELREHLGGSSSEGVLVSKVLDGSAAQRAGFEVGDLILSVDGASVASVEELRRELHSREGQRFAIRVARRGDVRSLEVEIAEPGEDRPTGPRAAAPRAMQAQGSPLL